MGRFVDPGIWVAAFYPIAQDADARRPRYLGRAGGVVKP